MSISANSVPMAHAVAVLVTDEMLSVELNDGRTISVPLGWYPRLEYGTTKERQNWRLIGHGEGIHWADLDEDISVAGLLRGSASGESQESFARWLNARQS